MPRDAPMPRDARVGIPDLAGDHADDPRPRPLLRQVVARPAAWTAAALLVVVVAARFAWPVAAPGSALGIEFSAAGLLAMGMTAVIVAGGIDLSVGAVAAMATSIAAAIIHGGGPWWLAAACGVAGGAAVGLVNGLLVAVATLSPVMVTLGSFAAGNAAAALLHGRSPVAAPWTQPLWLLAGVAAVLAWVLPATVWGRHLFAIGGNAQAALANGVKVAKVTVQAYLLSATLASLAGLTLLAAPGLMTTPGIEVTLQALAAAVVGGASLSGGEGGICGALLGAGLVVAVRHVLLLAGIDVEWLGLGIGVCLMGALLMARRHPRRF